MSEVHLKRTLSSVQITAVAFGFMVAASTWAIVAGAFGVYGFGFIWTAVIGMPGMSSMIKGNTSRRKGSLKRVA